MTHIAFEAVEAPVEVGRTEVCGKNVPNIASHVARSVTVVISKLESQLHSF